MRKSCEKVARCIVAKLEHNWKHVSFICDRNSIVSVGWNQPYKTHPLAHKFGYRYNCLHSELHAICNFEYPVSQLYRYRMINIRVDKFGKLKIAKPCKICQVVLASFNINEVWYSNHGGYFDAF